MYQQPIQVNDMTIDNIQEFTYVYLGSKMTVDENVEMEVKERTRKARHAYQVKHGSHVK